MNVMPCDTLSLEDMGGWDMSELETVLLCVCLCALGCGEEMLEESHTSFMLE